MSVKTMIALVLCFSGVNAYAESDRPLTPEGLPCYYFSNIPGTDKSEIYVQSSCLTEEGKKWISGEMVSGAKDLTQAEPTYYGFRDELRRSVVQGYSYDDEAIYSQFKSIGRDDAKVHTIPSQNSLRLPPENGTYMTMQRLPLPYENGEKLIALDPELLRNHLKKLKKVPTLDELDQIIEQLTKNKAD